LSKLQKKEMHHYYCVICGGPVTAKISRVQIQSESLGEYTIEQDDAESGYLLPTLPTTIDDRDFLYMNATPAVDGRIVKRGDATVNTNRENIICSFLCRSY